MNQESSGLFNQCLLRYSACQTWDEFILSYKSLLLLVVLNVLLFHAGKLVLIAVWILFFFIGFCFYNLKNEQNEQLLDVYLRCKRQVNTNFFKMDPSLEAMNESVNESDLLASTGSVNSALIKPSLTGSYLVDDELHKIIELLIRDYVDAWYKSDISNKDDFSKTIRVTIYNAVRYVNSCLKQIDCEQFLLNIVAHNLVVQMRLLKKAKEKLNQTKSTNIISDKNAQNETNLIETFFDLEAELEKGICRDQISFDSSDKEQEFLQEISEILCYSLLSPKTFNCLPLRCLIREILANHLLKYAVDKLTDPDYINQSIIYLLNEHPLLTENFLIALNLSDSLDELNEVKLKIDEEILRTRSNDKGGQNDQEIKLRLSSLQYVRRRIDICIANLLNTNSKPKKSTQNQQNLLNYLSNQEEINKLNRNLNKLDFSVVVGNQTIQHCFIEFMGKENVQNLISFYLNANMYRQFAIKELSRNDLKDLNELKMTLKDFAKGLINSYLLSAVNFVATDQDEEPVNIVNRQYYKQELAHTVERLESDEYLNEFLLDELQSKIYLLMKQKYYPRFKTYSEFHKILLKNDLIVKLTSQIESPDDSLNSSNHEEEEDSNSLVLIDQLSNFEASLTLSNENKFKLTAVISSSGKCNDLKSTYAIYIIDVTKINEDGKAKNEFWQTYRRFNDFYDLHLFIKKKFPNLKNLILPGKSFRNSLSDEFLEKRRIELNKYLQTLCNPYTLMNNHNLIELMLQFLENKRWDNTQTNFDRRVDSIFLSTVKNIQTSIKNAPDNVIGMVKGLSDNLISNSVVDTFSKMNTAMPTTTSNSSLHSPTIENSDITNFKTNKTDLTSIDRTTLNSDDNLPVRVVLVLIDEVFDLKEKNQWIRQSLMSIVKSFMKNFKGDSMNKKIKEQIAGYLNEEHLARYLKNFRKRIWPKGLLADASIERSKSMKEITKILAKTKLLATVSDDLRHILGNNTTRRGVFDLFDLFQHKALNKRLMYILLENLMNNFFINNLNSSSMSTIFHYSYFSLSQLQQEGNGQKESVQLMPLSKLIRIHLSKSARIRLEHKNSKLKTDHDNLRRGSAIVNSPSLSLSPSPSISSMLSIALTSSVTDLPRSKSLHSEINC